MASKTYKSKLYRRKNNDWVSRFGLNLVESLSKLNVDLIAIDVDKESVRRASEFTHHVFACDSTDEEALKACGIHSIDHVIVAIGQNEKANLTSSIMTIIKLKTLGIKHITARADDEDYVEVLKLVGATSIVTPLKIASDRIANKIAAGNVIDYFNIRNDFDVFEIHVSSGFESIKLIDLSIKTKYRINILLIERKGKMIVPNKDTEILPNDDIFIFGQKKDINKTATFFEG